MIILKCFCFSLISFSVFVTVFCSQTKLRRENIQPTIYLWKVSWSYLKFFASQYWSPFCLYNCMVCFRYFQVWDAFQYMVWWMQFHDCQGCKVQRREKASGKLLFYKGIMNEDFFWICWICQAVVNAWSSLDWIYSVIQMEDRYWSTCSKSYQVPKDKEKELFCDFLLARQVALKWMVSNSKLLIFMV